MPIDPRIPMMGDPVFDGAAALERGFSLRDAARRSQMQDAEYAQKQQDRVTADNRRQQFGQALGGMVPPELAEFAKADPEGAMKLWEFKKSASAEQKAAAMEVQTVLGNAASTLRNVPYEQRRQALEQMAPQLAQMGVSPEQLQGFDPTDGAIDGIVAQTLGVKGVLEFADKAEGRRLTARGQDITVNGQSITMRGQDMTAASAAAGRNVTLRGQNISADNSRRSASGGGAGKTLPAGDVAKLSTEAGTVQGIRDLRGTFKDAFSGPGTGVGNLAARVGVGNARQGQQSDWWQQMEAFDNVVRNQLFGASLTAGEQNAWERTTVTPSMAPARIKSNLAARDKILERALGRKVEAYQAAGYNAGGVGQVLAPSAPAAPAQRTAAPGRPAAKKAVRWEDM
jgi:hypothetical protein